MRRSRAPARFAELDEASRFAQPESIEPFAQPAPGGETVNTDTATAAVGSGNVEPPVPSLASPSSNAVPSPHWSRDADLPVAEAAPGRTAGNGHVRSPSPPADLSNTAAPAADGMPELDPALLGIATRGNCTDIFAGNAALCRYGRPLTWRGGGCRCSGAATRRVRLLPHHQLRASRRPCTSSRQHRHSSAARTPR